MVLVRVKHERMIIVLGRHIQGRENGYTAIQAYKCAYSALQTCEDGYCAWQA